ncbi:MAG TPA: CheR family methyltransferase [Microvirga sp.]|jgi:two-component system CheB/CheR fusion protein|nr:CheR family methyltransferase [Microvirga sp.]
MDQTGSPDPDVSPGSHASDFLVVGIGASAGGLEALREFLRPLAVEPGYALILVQHVSDSERFLMAEVFARLTGMPVVPVEEGLALEPNRFYVAPPNTLLGFKNGRFRLRPPRNPGERRNPIDRFFQTLAAAYETESVGIVLSGSGSDGALGLGSIGAAGGMTMAQAPDTAAFTDMPSSVAASADHVLPPAGLAEALDTYARHWRAITSGSGLGDRRREIQARLPETCDVLLRRTGHDFKHYKVSTLVRRIERRMQVRSLHDVDSYVGHLARDIHEPHVLFRELLIGVTSFFREPDSFHALGERVIAALLGQRSASDQVRIWIPGCATGEEAYTIAMIVREKLDAIPNAPKVQIFATDVNERALVAARRGSYPQGITAQVSPERLARFFVKRGRRYQVTDELREMCLFSVHNLISDPPFSRLDLISCRNVLIYLGSHLQKKLIPVFHYALRSGGYLFVGASESLTGHNELFRVIDAKHRIAQRKEAALHVPGSLRDFGTTTIPGWRAANPAAEVDLGAVAQRILLDEFAPKYAIVSEEGQVVFLSEGVDIYIQPPAGSFSNNIMRMVRRGLSVGLRTAFNQAIRTRRTVAREVPAVHTAEGLQSVRVTVQPMPELGHEDGLYMIVFQDHGPPLRRSEEAAAPAHPDADALIEGLERELLRTREDLERTVQDLEAANEELKSSNEELLSMNEELQSANEELETSKEEVQAVNHALASANADLENLLRSTRIATIFLDREGAIRGFTPAASDIYHIASSDIGRPLSHFTHRLVDIPPLPGFAELDGATGGVDHEARSHDGRWFLRRVLPYRTAAGAVDGIVVTFTEVTKQKESETALRRSEEKLRVALEAARLGAWERDLATGELAATAMCKVNLGLDPDAPLTFDQLQGMRHPDDQDRVTQAIRDAIAENRDYDVEYRAVKPDGTIGWILARGHAVYDASGRPVRMVGVTLDITERESAKQALQQVERRQGFLLDLHDRLKDLDDPLAVMETAAERLGRHLAVSRVGYGEIDAAGEHVLVDRDWTDGSVTSVRGRHRLNDFGPEIIAALKEGRTIRVDDVAGDSRTSAPSTAAAFAAIETRAVLAVPLCKGGRMVAMIYLHHPAPRAWSDEDAVAVEEVGERTWAALERARIEAALRESEARFRSMANSAPVMIWINSAATGCEFVNQAYLDFFGKRLEEVLGFGWAPSAHPEDGPRYLAAYQEAVATASPFQAEARFRRADGEYRWLISNGLPRLDPGGNLLGFIGSSLDITEVKRAETEMRGTAERLRLALEASRMGDWIWDPATDVVTLSARAAEIFGIPPGPHMTWTAMQGLLHPEDARRAAAGVETAVATRGGYDVEYRIRRPSDGSDVWVAAKGQATYGADGAILGMIGVVQDVTERKAAEERQALLIRELHHRVKNTLATVQAIVGSTARTASSIDEFYQAFVGRIVSLAQTHTLLTEDYWQTASLTQLLRNELGPYDEEDRRIEVDGPPVELNSEAAVPIGMAIHELTTNAAKYGALSDRGRVEVRWALKGEPDRPMLHFAWTETGGPPVRAPTRQGFGSRLLQRVLATQLQAEVHMDFAPEGLRFSMIMPVPKPVDPYLSLKPV